MNQGHWSLALYDDLMIDLLLDRAAPGEIERDVDFLVERLQLPEHARVLDQGCGLGTHAAALARRGFRAHGVDLVPACIDEAKRRARNVPDATFGCADVARFSSPLAYDGAYSLGSCIGHGSDEDTRAQLAAAYESLVVGARYVVETLGIYGVLARFEPHSILRGHTRRGAVTLLRETSLDLARGLMHKRWTYLLEGGKSETHESTFRFYAPHELAERMQDAGFTVEAVLGGTHGAPLGRDDARMVLIARKEAKS